MLTMLQYCGSVFCFICGEAVEHNGIHWLPGNPCPRYNQPGAPNAIFDVLVEDSDVPDEDAEGSNEDAEESDAESDTTDDDEEPLPRTLSKSDSHNLQEMEYQWNEDLDNEFQNEDDMLEIFTKLRGLLRLLSSNAHNASHALIQREEWLYRYAGDVDPEERKDNLARDAAWTLRWQVEHERIMAECPDTLRQALEIVEPDSALRLSPWENETDKPEGQRMFSLAQSFERYATIHAPRHLRVIAEFDRT